MFLVFKNSPRLALHLLEGETRILRSQTRSLPRKGNSDGGDGKGSKKKPKGKAPNQGYWDDNYDTDDKFAKKVDSDFERLMKMGEKEADPKDMDVTARNEGEAAPTRTWLGVGPGPPKGKKGGKGGKE